MDDSVDPSNDARSGTFGQLVRHSALELIVTFFMLFGVTSIVRWVIGPSLISRTFPEIQVELLIVGASVAILIAGLILSPPGRAIDESGLREALQGLAERWTVPGGLRCDFRSANVPEDRLSDASRHQLLRIAQEAIQNAARHANRTLIAITLRWSAPNLILKLTDDGTGIPALRLKNCAGFGLQNMRQRVQDMCGEFEMQTATGRGTSIIVTVSI